MANYSQVQFMKSYFHYCSIMNIPHSPPKLDRRKLTLSQQLQADTQTFLSRPSAKIADPNQDLKNAYSKDFFKEDRFEHMYYLRRLRTKVEEDSVTQEIPDDEEFKIQSPSKRTSSRLPQNAHTGLSTTFIQPNKKTQAQSNIASQKQHMTQYIKIQTDSDSLQNVQVEAPVPRKRGRPKGSKNRINRLTGYHNIQQQKQPKIEENQNQLQVLPEQTDHHSQGEENGGGQQEQKRVGKQNGMTLRNKRGKNTNNCKRQRKQVVEQVKQVRNKTVDDGNQLYEYQEISSDAGQQQREQRNTHQATQSLPIELEKSGQLPNKPSSIKPSAQQEAQTNELQNLDNTLVFSKSSTESQQNIHKTPQHHSLLIEPTLIQYNIPISKIQKLKINSNIFSENILFMAPPDLFTKTLFKGWTRYYHKFTQAIALELAQEDEEEQQLQADSKKKRPKQTTFSRYRKVLTVAEVKTREPSNSTRKRPAEEEKRVSEDRRRTRQNQQKRSRIPKK